MAFVPQIESAGDGAWKGPLERGVNLLDGGAPFYAVYETGDGKYMAVGAIESKSYSELLQLLELDEPSETQNDQSTWPAVAAPPHRRDVPVQHPGALERGLRELRCLRIPGAQHARGAG